MTKLLILFTSALAFAPATITRPSTHIQASTPIQNAGAAAMIALALTGTQPAFALGVKDRCGITGMGRSLILLSYEPKLCLPYDPSHTTRKFDAAGLIVPSKARGSDAGVRRSGSSATASQAAIYKATFSGKKFDDLSTLYPSIKNQAPGGTQGHGN